MRTNPKSRNQVKTNRNAKVVRDIVPSENIKSQFRPKQAQQNPAQGGGE